MKRKFCLRRRREKAESFDDTGQGKMTNGL